MPFSSKGEQRRGRWNIDDDDDGDETATTLKRGTDSTSWNAKNDNDQQNNGIRRDDIVSTSRETRKTTTTIDDSTAENIQQLRETIQKEHENKADSQEEQKLDDSPLVKSMRELGVGSPCCKRVSGSRGRGSPVRENFERTKIERKSATRASIDVEDFDR